MSTYTRQISAQLGASRTGLGSSGTGVLGVTITDIDGTVRLARSTTGITEVGTSGFYYRSVTWDTAWGDCRAVWDDHASSPTFRVTGEEPRRAVDVIHWIGTDVTVNNAGIPRVDVVNVDGESAGAIGLSLVGEYASTNAGRVLAALENNVITAAALATDAVTEIAAGVLNAARSSYIVAGSVGEAIGMIDDIDDAVQSVEDIVDSLEAGEYGVTISPFQAQQSTTYYANRDITEILKGSAPTLTFVVTDQTGAAVSLSGKTVRLVAYSVTNMSQTTHFKKETGGSGITISGSSNNTVTVQLSASDTATARSARYVLWNITDNLPLASGALPIKDAPKDHS